MPPATRARLGGLGTVAKHGPAHMAAVGRVGQTGLDARIAREAGIEPGAPDYEARFAAAKRAYYVRLAYARWSRTRSKGVPR